MDAKTIAAELVDYLYTDFPYIDRVRIIADASIIIQEMLDQMQPFYDNNEDFLAFLWDKGHFRNITNVLVPNTYPIWNNDIDECILEKLLRLMKKI